ncbi:hypothetical protein ES703_65604 [subsurface metagenome]
MILSVSSEVISLFFLLNSSNCAFKSLISFSIFSISLRSSTCLFSILESLLIFLSLFFSSFIIFLVSLVMNFNIFSISLNWVLKSNFVIVKLTNNFDNSQFKSSIVSLEILKDSSSSYLNLSNLILIFSNLECLTLRSVSSSFNFSTLCLILFSILFVNSISSSLLSFNAPSLIALLRLISSITSFLVSSSKSYIFLLILSIFLIN